MNIMIATGGLDELAIDVGYAIISAIFALVVGLTAFSWWKRSRVTAILAIAIILVNGFLIQPWTFIVPPAAKGPYDQTWQFNMRIISVVWLLLFIVTAAGLTRIIKQRKAKTNVHNIP